MPVNFTGSRKRVGEAMAKTYEVLTWDSDKSDFTPQRGVRRGPYSQFGLRKALRKLRQIGYEINRASATAILVQRTDPGWENEMIEDFRRTGILSAARST